MATVRLTDGSLSKVGVELWDKYQPILRCEHCCATWRPDAQTGGRLPRGWWKCPNGCNADGKPFDNDAAEAEKKESNPFEWTKTERQSYIVLDGNGPNPFEWTKKNNQHFISIESEAALFRATALWV